MQPARKWPKTKNARAGRTPSLVVLAWLGVTGTHCSDVPAGSRAMVASYNRLAREAALVVLERGGHAVDAFIAATFVEYVVGYGITTLAGPLGALVHDAEDEGAVSLEASWAAPLDPQGLFDPAYPASGAKVLIHGAPRALEALWQRYGRLPWSDLLEPARRIAQSGFAIDQFYAVQISHRQEVLARSEYGRRTFFSGGSPLGEGDTLRQPELAGLLAILQEQGVEPMYTGDWAREFVDAVNAAGGQLSPADLENYRPTWSAPWEVEYRGTRVQANAGRNFGGLAVLLALEVSERGIELAGEPATEVDRMERRIRTARTLSAESWLVQPEILDDPSRVSQYLGYDYTRGLWDLVSQQLASHSARSGSHSFHVLVVDGDGNAVTGTNTINGSSWGDGLVVRGVYLTDAGGLGSVPAPGERVPLPLSMHLAFRDGGLWLVSGTFAYSLMEAEFQFLLQAIDEGLDARGIVSKPRFGTFPLTAGSADPSKNWLDPGVPAEVVQELVRRGLAFEQVPYADTGLGGVILIRPDGSLDGAVAPHPFFPAAGTATTIQPDRR